MSNLVFPSSLAGCDIKITSEPVDDVQADESASGKEIRQTASTYQRKRWMLDFNILRADSSMADSTRWRELQQLFTHWARSFGRLSDFLFTDPDDSSVTDMGFGVGDGSTTAFQLQRTMAGDLIDAAGFEYRAQTKPYTNYSLNSSFETDTNADGTADNWANYNGSTNVPQVLRIVPGMNGGKAQRVSWGTANNDTRMGLIGAVPAATWITNQWFTISYFARAQGGIVGQTEGLQWNNGPSTSLTIANPALTGSWQRYVFQVFWNNGTTVEATNSIYLGLAGTGVFGDIDFDLVQVVKGQHGVSEFQPVETPAATSGTRTPSYWPGYADGFEPITDLNGDVTIYEDGTWRGRRTLYPWTRTNLVPFSEQFSNAAWVKTNSTITADTTTAPDGTSTADTFSEGAAVTVQHFVEETIAAEVTGELRCYSVFLKANNLPNVTLITNAANTFLNFSLVTGAIIGQGTEIVASGVIIDPRWPGWSRVWWVHRATSLASSFRVLAQQDGTYSGAAYTGTNRTFFVWGAMSERVSNLNGPTPYIPTPSSSAVTVVDYTLSSSGVFTPVAVPAAGTFFSWDGAFYRRCRFDMDSVPSSREAQAMWSAKQIRLISVK